MTATALDALRPAVPAPDTAHRGERWRVETVTSRGEPENHLIGALMWLPATQARVIADLVPDTAIWWPLNRWAYEIIAQLAATGHDPEPVTVLAHARHRAARQAIHPHQPPTPAQHHRLAVHLANLYTHTSTPAAATDYARAVLDDAYRRAFAAHATRMTQLAEADVEHSDLAAQFSTICDDLADLNQRVTTAAQPGWAQI